MNIAKKLAALLSASVLLLGAGCTKGESSTSVPDFSYPDNPLGAASSMIPDVKLDKYSVPENEGMEFVKNLKVGWNLGNTFDAVDMKNISKENELDYEKGWCGAICGRSRPTASSSLNCNIRQGVRLLKAYPCPYDDEEGG